MTGRNLSIPKRRGAGLGRENHGFYDRFTSLSGTRLSFLTGLAALVALLACVADLSGLLSAATLNLLALSAILVVGVPHGALDVALASKVDLLVTRQNAVFGLLGYLALVLAVIAAWLIAPLPTFFAFLLMSALHFGADGELASLENPILKTATGALPITLPAFFHHEQYAALIAPLVADEAALATQVTGIAGLACLAMIICAAAFNADVLRKFPHVALLAASSALLDPLISFAIYFIVLHSMQHYREHWADYQSRLASTIASAVACAALFGAVFALLYRFSPAFAGAPTAALLFLLSAVSLPHAVLVAYARAHRASRGNRGTVA